MKLREKNSSHKTLECLVDQRNGMFIDVSLLELDQLKSSSEDFSAANVGF